MGNESSKDKFFGKNLSITYKKFNFEDVDACVQKGFRLVKQSEIFRCRFVPIWLDYLIKTGAIVIESPNFESGVNGLLLKLSNDLNENLFSLVFISPDSPFITTKFQDDEISHESQKIIDSFIDICSYCDDNYEEVSQLKEAFEKFKKESLFIQSNLTELFNEKGCSPNEVDENKRCVKKYLSIFKSSFDNVTQIKRIFDDSKSCLEKYEKYTSSESTMNKFDKFGKESRLKGYTAAPKILYKYSPEKTLPNYEDYYDRESDFNKIEKNAIHLLGVYIPSEKRKYSHNSSKYSNKTNNSFSLSNKENIKPFSRSSKDSIKEKDTGKDNELFNQLENDSSADSKSEKLSPKQPGYFHITNEIKVPSKSYVTTLEHSNILDVLICGLLDGEIIIYKLSTLEKEKVIQCHKNEVTALFLTTQDDVFLISASRDGELYKHTIESYQSTLLLKETSIDCGLDLKVDNKILLGEGGDIVYYDLALVEKTFSFHAHEDVITEIIYSDEREMFASSSRDKVIKIWDRENKCIGVLKGVNDEINCICFSQYESYLILCSVSKNGNVTFWNLSDKDHTKSINKLGRSVKCFDLDNKKNVIVVNIDGFSLFNINDFSSQDFREEEGKVISTGKYLKNGETVIIATKNSCLQFWNAN